MKKIFFSLLSLFLLCVISFVIVGGGFSDRSSEYIPHSHSPIVFAHRGVVEQYPENSLPAFQTALNLGYTSIETDVRQTKDGVLILFHDANTERLLHTNQELKDVYWKEIETAHLWHKDTLTPYHPISLEQLFTLLPDSTLVYLDMKEYSWDIGEALIDILERFQRRENTIVASTNLANLIHLRYHNSEIITVLEGFSPGKETFYSLIPKRFKPDYLSSFWHAATAEQTTKLAEANRLRRRIVYGVDPSNISTVQALGIPHIIYDHTSNSKDVEYIRQSLQTRP